MTSSIDFKIPDTIFLNEQEEKMLKIPLPEKPLSYGPSSSHSGRIYKVQYILQFSLKHDGYS